jgi:hypothetical protein
MAKISLECFIKNLPPYIGKEIFAFLIPDSRNINFRKYAKYGFCGSYSPRYDAAFVKDQVIKNKTGTYLSMINKKNGKHRYYLTDENETSYCHCCGEEGCCSKYCRGRVEYYHSFTSRFVGKDIDKALIELMLTSKR